MTNFFTILSWMMLFAFLIRIGGIIFGSRSPQERALVKLAEKMGANPIGDALRIPVIGVIICTAWIVSTYI